jgi:hypothetical protein
MKKVEQALTDSKYSGVKADGSQKKALCVYSMGLAN